MSRKAAALGVVDYLRTVLAGEGFEPDKAVTYEPTGKPPKAAGQFHVAVKGAGSRTLAARHKSSDRAFSVQIGLHLKANNYPGDRKGLAVTGEGLLEIADRLQDGLVCNYDLVRACDAHVEGAGVTTNGFEEPFQECSDGDVQEGESGTLTVTLLLSGLRRLTV